MYSGTNCNNKRRPGENLAPILTANLALTCPGSELSQGTSTSVVPLRLLRYEAPDRDRDRDRLGQTETMHNIDEGVSHMPVCTVSDMEGKSWLIGNESERFGIMYFEFMYNIPNPETS